MRIFRKRGRNGGYCNETNRLEIFTFGDDEKILVTARFDNLGKGSSGAAVQNMNLKIGAKESTGLHVMASELQNTHDI